MKYLWERFLKEGEALHTILTTNFDSLIDGNTIKHFFIIEGMYRSIANVDLIAIEMGDDIEKALLPWIKKEYEEGRLIDKTLWRPFHDATSIVTMYYGYRKLFRYDKYIFQLAMETDCIADICEYCNPTDDLTPWRLSENGQHFSLSLYGWKDDDSNMLQPGKYTVIPEDDIMPDKDWKYGIVKDNI
jgi:hypothetical protein